MKTLGPPPSLSAPISMNPKTLSGDEIGSPLLSFRPARCLSARFVASVSDCHTSTKSLTTGPNRARAATPSNVCASSVVRPRRVRRRSSPSRYSSVITPVGVIASVSALTYLSPSSSKLTLAAAASKRR